MTEAFTEFEKAVLDQLAEIRTAVTTGDRDWQIIAELRKQLADARQEAATAQRTIVPLHRQLGDCNNHVDDAKRREVAGHLAVDIVGQLMDKALALAEAMPELP